MSLPHNSTTAFVDELTPGRALPHAEQDRWMRPYRPGPWRVATAALLLILASYLLFAALIMVAAGSGQGGVTCLLSAFVIIAVTLRLLRVGVWVSGKGLRQVEFFSTSTVSWSQVVSVRTAQQPVRVLGLPRSVQGQALVITRRGGRPLRPMLTDHNADFLGRVEAFDLAADAIEGWAAELR
ncbi:hypothetical protein [Streptomyces sp. CBMA29]|uniref:hypothetical protein n=1 Tax=Streptomyces sp. CBMA29 TaxID=1896314 RepID=UPI0016619716|nr:hypothetical protein [Streptomyces sp. CBMA29]MBD0735517.1 hypothetical protein [Streptomyces sp. CBMA29]